MKPHLVESYTETETAELLAIVDRALQMVLDHVAKELIADALESRSSEVVMRNMLRAHAFDAARARERLELLRVAVLSGMQKTHEAARKVTS